MTIRARLLLLTVGLAVPLVLAGFYNLWEAWNLSREQLDDSIERQAELAATAFEQWIEAHTLTLDTIATLSQNNNPASLRDYLNSIVKTRPFWLDVQIVDASGKVTLSQNVRDKPIPLVSIETIRKEISQKQGLVVITEQISEEKVRLLSIALPIANGNFVVARIEGEDARNVFSKLKLPEDHIIAVFDPNGRLLYRNNASPEQVSSDVNNTPLLSALDGKKTATIEVESPYDKIRRVYGISRIEAIDCVVAVGVPSAALYAPARRQYSRQLWIGVAILCFAIILALYVARGIVEPMRRLSQAARAFGAGDLRARAEIGKPKSVFGRVGETFNQMAVQIAERAEKQKELDRLKSEFVSSVSHELRTPLTTIKTLVSVLEEGDPSPEEKTEYLRTIAIECDRQIEFIKNLLDISRIETDTGKVNLIATDLSEIVRQSIDSHKRSAAARGLSLFLGALPEKPMAVYTEPDILRRVVSSVIENALKYTPMGGQISVSINHQNDRVSVNVCDTGPGIAIEDQGHIFEKFYRGRPLLMSGDDGDEFSNTEPGTGLGLYLVKTLVDRINGQISVQSPAENGGGTCFMIDLPAAADNPA